MALATRTGVQPTMTPDRSGPRTPSPDISFEHADAQRLASSFDEAVATLRGPYKAGAPRRLQEMFEAIAHGIEFERRTEHQRATPGWWVHRRAARTLLQILVTAIRAFFHEVRAELIDPQVADTSPDAARMRRWQATAAKPPESCRKAASFRPADP
jgi:hypothetical protein